MVPMPDDVPEPRYERDETAGERLDRNYAELLQELRLLQAGMKVLFGFLLSLAFQSRFVDVTDFQQNIYLVILVSAALATGVLIAPVSFHRWVFGRGMKDDLIAAVSRYVAGGLVLLFITVVGAVLLVMDFLTSPTAAIIVTSCVGVAFICLWAVFPLRVLARNRRRP